MAYDVTNEHVRPRPLAARRATVAQSRLGDEIRHLVGTIWPVLREQRVATGHNVVVYHGDDDGMLSIEAGVEVPAGFTESGEVRSSATPAGEVATVAYFGDYARMHPAYVAL